MNPSSFLRLGFALAFSLVAARAQQVTFTPASPNAIYAVGDKVAWTVGLPAGAAAPEGKYSYTIKKDNVATLKSGEFALASGPVTLDIEGTEPAMLYLQVALPAGSPPPPPTRGNGPRNLAAAAVSPERIQPVVARPADFDAFWEEKIKLLKAVPEAAQITPGESDKPGVEYYSVRLNNINGARVYGQLAKPAREGKFPALLQMQYAGVYPLQKQWVTDRAAEGWLAFNVMAHDLPYDRDQAFYAALPAMIRNYNSLYNDNRDRNYFLQMYLGDYRALDYLSSRPDWDGRVLVVTGTSMGGQQSFAMAGLHPKVTHMMIRVPAGADSNAALHGRAPSYPNWDRNNPKVMETALYFDAVNFAPRIKATSLVGFGFIDPISAPTGVWTAFNLIPGPKEAVPMIDAAHDNQATAEQLKLYADRSTEWFKILASGGDVTVDTSRVKPAGK